MALGDKVIVLNDASLSLGGTDVSNAVKKVTLRLNHVLVNVNRMGRKGPQRNVSDSYDWQIDVEFGIESHYAVNEINQVMQALMPGPLGAATSNAAMILKGLSEAVSTSNPTYSGSVSVDSWSPIGDSGEWGENMMVSRSFMGATDLTKATA